MTRMGMSARLADASIVLLGLAAVPAALAEDQPGGRDPGDNAVPLQVAPATPQRRHDRGGARHLSRPDRQVHAPADPLTEAAEANRQLPAPSKHEFGPMPQRLIRYRHPARLARTE